jgi:hypothetical protein
VCASFTAIVNQSVPAASTAGLLSGGPCRSLLVNRRSDLAQDAHEESHRVAVPPESLQKSPRWHTKGKELTRKCAVGGFGLHESCESIEPITQIRDTLREPSRPRAVRQSDYWIAAFLAQHSDVNDPANSNKDARLIVLDRAVRRPWFDPQGCNPSAFFSRLRSTDNKSLGHLADRASSIRCSSGDPPSRFAASWQNRPAQDLLGM